MGVPENISAEETPVVEAMVVPVDTTEMVQVVAPADLNEGYSFNVVVGGSTFPVTVVSFDVMTVLSNMMF